MSTGSKLFFAFVILIFCSGSGLAADQKIIFVSIVPQKYFVQQIGRNLVDVRVMVQPGASPTTYEPKPGQMADLSKSEVYFAIGVAFENVWLKKIAAANPEMKVVHTDQGITKLPMAAHHHPDEAGDPHPEKGEAPGKDHSERSGLDPHIWLSPPLVKHQARTILTALQEIDPDRRDVYEANFRQFAAAVDSLDRELRQTLADGQGLQFMVFHPAWGTFAHTYGLQQVPIEIQGKDPKPSQLKDLIEYARKRGIRVIFVQPQFSHKSAKLVAGEINGQVVIADPLAEDWMTNLREVANKLKAALK
ncbi:metal ABC transporter solute-binding protein, Zn/Mn family [Desulfosarcina sp.]|uniref:metal ABC transporter solute-binding protein, Zn/Mn family n=1 Tax=Desulfosarcina sp. TaxID=2027861 RepID=UPI0039708B4E